MQVCVTMKKSREFYAQRLRRLFFILTGNIALYVGHYEVQIEYRKFYLKTYMVAVE